MVQHVSSPGQLRLDGQVALVTGAARGLGLSHSQRLAAAGATVYLTDVTDDEIKTAAETVPGGHAARMDVCDDREIEDVIARIEHEQGRLDILVNNAGGITGFIDPAAGAAAAFRTVVDLNLSGTFAVSTAAARLMKSTGDGRIVITSSSTARRHAQVAASYIAAKAGLVALTSALARDWGADGIRVNAVSPGFIAHDGLHAKIDPELVAQMAASWANAQSLPRAGTPDDVSDAVLYLVSSLSSFVTGQVLLVDGGWTFT